MDIIMQGMDGLDASEIILKEHPDARIVMVSSLAYDDTFERAKAIGAKGFVDKPFHQEQACSVQGLFQWYNCHGENRNTEHKGWDT